MVHNSRPIDFTVCLTNFSAFGAIQVDFLKGEEKMIKEEEYCCKDFLLRWQVRWQVRWVERERNGSGLNKFDETHLIFDILVATGPGMMH